MIVSAPLFIALAKPAAHIAMRARLRVGLFAAFVRADLLEPRPYISVVRRILCNPVGFGFETLARNHIHELRRFALNPLQ